MDKVRKYIGYEQCTFKGNINPVSICILDSGIAQHMDFKQRIIDFADFVNHKHAIYDRYGHGTHIAGICAGSGMESNGKYMGISPNAKLVVGKVLEDNGEGKIDYLLNGIEWCIHNREKYDIRLLNISVGLIQKVEERKQKEIIDAVEYAWDLGIITICAAGNNGPQEGSVTIPGTSAKVITVGSMDVGKSYAIPSKYSGRGPTSECVIKPEIYAPGRNIMSCSHNGSYTRKTGTSMSVPVVTGSVALLLQRFPDMTPVDVKIRLFERSKAFGSQNHQSWGQIYLPTLLSI